MADQTPQLNVVQVGSSLYDWGGIERYVAYLTGGLRERGHEVWVTCPAGSPLMKQVVKSCVPIGLRSRFSLSALTKTVQFLRRVKPDVMHVHFSPDYRMAGYAGRLAKVPFVVLTRHMALPWSSRRVRQSLAFYDHFIPVSEASRQALLESGIPSERMTVAKHGVPPLVVTRDRQSVRNQFGISDRFVVGSFGRLVEGKGLQTLVGAANQLPKVEVAIFGDGPYESDIRRQIQGFGLEDRVKLHGYIPDVANAMSAMDAIAIPSLWSEAFPSATLEAMSLARPIVASRIGGLPEQITDGETGLLFTPGDAPDLASRIDLLAQDPSLCLKLGKSAAELQKQEYTVPKFAARVEAVYLRN